MEGIKKRKNVLIEEYASMAERSNRIDPELYKKYDVKRGLRDITGKGVLAGLTEIGEVSASYVNERGESVPGPGRLIYRGMDIKDIVNGFLSDGRFGFEEVA